MIGQGIYQFFKRLALKERSVSKLTASFCLGVYIAFSPFIGFHNIMIICFAWLFSLNASIIFIAAHIFNNPWTMIPIYGSEYMLGNWLLSHVFCLDGMALNPGWMSWINSILVHKIGINGISLWAFLLGGNLVGLVLALVLYPVVKKLFERITLYAS